MLAFFFGKLNWKFLVGGSSDIPVEQATQPLGYMKPQQEEIYFVGNVDKKTKAKKSLAKLGAQSIGDLKPTSSMVIQTEFK